MTADSETGPTRSGRRPGHPGTRDAILDAARDRFAEVGYDRASIRSIATAAGVDSALVHHYFGTKQNLLTAALQLPIDPEVVTAQFAAVPVEQLGETIVYTIVSLWDSPLGVPAVAAFRSLLTDGDAALARAFLLEVALKDVRARVDSPPGSGAVRVVLSASQMIGVLTARKLVRIEPIASMPVARLAALVGPTLQRYLTGELPLSDDEFNSR